ncbi:MAG TPA: hypothetical protein VF658_11470 [Pyrinomonadaceae bacterium]|jgi:hypothetical protein
MSAAPQLATAARVLTWLELSAETRSALAGRLVGLYERQTDESAFNELALDKQQSLLILLRRFRELKLWETVRRVENVYGLGGVGMNFAVWPFIKSTLERRKEFTTWFARHSDTTGGWIERGVGRASLHVLYVEKGTVRQWAAHFDLYNPWSSPMNAWRHLLHEKLKHYTPDWRAISSSLWGNEFNKS